MFSDQYLLNSMNELMISIKEVRESVNKEINNNSHLKSICKTLEKNDQFHQMKIITPTLHSLTKTKCEVFDNAVINKVSLDKMLNNQAESHLSNLDFMNFNIICANIQSKLSDTHVLLVKLDDLDTQMESLVSNPCALLQDSPMYNSIVCGEVSTPTHN